MILVGALASVSLAQTFVLEDDAILSSAGAPSVVHDGARYLMAYEAPAAPQVGCVETWSVELAQSTDGVHFSPTGARLRGSALSTCGVRSPGLALTDDGLLVAVFEAVQPDGSTRIGIADQLLGSTRVRLVPALDGLTRPSIARFDATWRILAVDPTYGLVTADSTDLATFTVEPTTVRIGATPWSAGGIESASLGCKDDAGWPWEVYYGGWSAGQTGWAWLVGSASDAWYVGAPIDLWADPAAWGGFDFVSDGTRTAVYFDWTDGGGVSHVGVTVSGGSFPDPSQLLGRDCRP